jgi:hypothetical protein
MGDVPWESRCADKQGLSRMMKKAWKPALNQVSWP